VDVAGQSGKSWGDALGELRLAVVRHKVLSALVLVAVVGSLVAIVIAGTRGSAANAANATSTGGDSWAIKPAGRPAAQPFSLPALGSAATVSLTHYAGRPLIVNFFASWCPPCAKETPMLARFYRSAHVAMVGIDGNDVTANALKFVRDSGVTYPVGWDPHNTVALSYDVEAFPQTFFLNARHQVVYRIFGAATPAQLATGVRLATGS
jgi:thiol-disulfide isomerase/thioredoxin